ncbi:IS200/IS605 family transposase [Streptomyces flaveus]|uniref:IS200/IS605 family transposase n=1 Tax=Streptomyces flaveus TaxID=66370 RepID=A0A917R0C9_9ACTN|nr:IS200/IS605 family transposase [Streptomyces flaveus]GGK79603.1 IS200/IS605 family transposase [Streptomyces flaveus]
MHVHLVFVTKFRHKVLADAHLRRMEEIMGVVCADFECELVEFHGEDNHVHLLVNFPPKAAGPSSSTPSRACPPAACARGYLPAEGWGEFPDLVRYYWRASKFWSGSYFAGTVDGAPLTVVRQYIEQQNRPA